MDFNYWRRFITPDEPPSLSIQPILPLPKKETDREKHIKRDKMDSSLLNKPIYHIDSVDQTIDLVSFYATPPEPSVFLALSKPVATVPSCGLVNFLALRGRTGPCSLANCVCRNPITK